MSCIHELSVNTLRCLSIDAIERAQSGHPGIALGAAPMAYALWGEHMRHNPANSDWLNRDRFLLSAGHGSALLYSLLHLFGYGISLQDLMDFRQLGSRTPGHPEYGWTRGVEVTTGPLGQGIGNGAGMAWAQSYLAATFNRPDFPIFDNFTYVLCGDGCLQQGVSAEASSLAGTLGLGKLIVLYDSNKIQIEGSTDIAFTEDVAGRYAAYHWQVLQVEDGNDLAAISAAISAAKADPRPSMIIVKTQIGYGAPTKAGSETSHGEALGEAELAGCKKNLGFDPSRHFYVPPELAPHMENIAKIGAKHEADWNILLENYAKKYPADYAELVKWKNQELPELIYSDEFFVYEKKDMPTRQSSGEILNRLAAVMPGLIGGAADLGPSCKSIMAGRGDFSAENPAGANLHFGSREHGMGAIANGMSLYGCLRPYIAGFFVFSDYMKPTMRMAGLMRLPVIHIFTHDSIGVGEDGPTHQPTEQLAMLRSIPNMTVIRPCDTAEVAAAYHLALTRTKSPTAIILTRQNTPAITTNGRPALRGGYILRDSQNPKVILIATGSEVHLACDAFDILTNQGIAARVVSLPSWEIFDEQDEDYRNAVLPPQITARIAIEAASPFGWERYTGLNGRIIGINRFGISAPAPQLFTRFGFTAENIAKQAKEILSTTDKHR